jgi:hypothetical protein
MPAVRQVGLGIDLPAQVPQEVPVTGWTAQAELLADAIREPGFKAAAVTASAWRAGVHAEATHGLVGAALALTGGDATGSLWDQVPPCPSDSVLLEQSAEVEGSAAELQRYCRDGAAACRAELGNALRARQAADAMLRAGVDEKSAAGARDVMEQANRVTGDCEAALEILDMTGAALGYALGCLRRVPDDFAQHYETPYAFKREAGPLPLSGLFLTGERVS